MRSLRLKLLGLSLIFCCFLPQPVAACSPARNPSDFSLEDYVENAPIIFVGTIVDGENPYSDSVIMTAQVEVERYFKGEGAAVEEISGFGYGSDCLSVVNLGGRYIFFASRNGDGSLQAVYMSAHDAAEHASGQNIAAISLITGQSNVPQALALDVQVSRFLAKNGQWLAGLSLGLLGLGGIFAMRRPSRKKKVKREELA